MSELVALTNNPFAYRLSWVLFHSLWQGGLAAVVLALLRPSLSRRSANARYLVSCCMLLVVLIAAVLTFCSEPLVAISHWPGETRSSSFPVLEGVVAQSTRVSHLFGIELADSLEKVRPWVFILWVSGVVVSSGRWAQGYWWVRKVTQGGNEPLELVWINRLEELKARLQISRPVRLIKSTFVEVPMVAGWLRPVILLPFGTLAGLTPVQVEAILAHELAHVRRYDYLVNALQNLVETLMFYHPGVWWISRCIREERELCCDDIVVRICGRRTVYARALFRLEQMRRGPSELALAANAGPLLRRIRRLLGAQEKDLPPGLTECCGLALIGLGLLTVTVGVWLMLGTSLYRAEATIDVHPGVTAPGDDSFGLGSRLVTEPYFIQTQCALIRSPMILKGVAELTQASATKIGHGKSGQEPTSREELNQLKNNVSVRQVPNTSLIKISVLNKEPDRAASLANSIAEQYREHRNEERKHVTEGVIEEVEKRLNDQMQRIAVAQSNVDFLRVSLKVPDAVASESAPTEGLFLSAETLRKVEELRVDSELELTPQKALLDRLKALGPDEFQVAQAINGVGGMQDALLNTELEQLTLVEQKLVALNKQNYGPEHHDVQSASAQSEDLKTKIKNRVNGILVGLETRVGALNQSLILLSNEVAKAKESDIEQANRIEPYFTAKRYLDELQRFRTLLYTKLAMEHTDLSLSSPSLVELVEEAVAPDRANVPNRARASVLMSGGFVLTLVGVFLARAGGKAQLL